MCCGEISQETEHLSLAPNLREKALTAWSVLVNVRESVTTQLGVSNGLSEIPPNEKDIKGEMMMLSSKTLRRLHVLYVTIFVVVIVVVLNREAWGLLPRLAVGIALMVVLYHTATALSVHADRVCKREKSFMRS